MNKKKKEVEEALAKYPTKVPIYVQRDVNCKDVPELMRKKYLVPTSLKLCEFLYYIRRQISVPSHVSLFLYVNDSLPSLNQTIGLIYDEEKSQCGYLYIFYASEHTFG